jgi:hypothetical protein
VRLKYFAFVIGEGRPLWKDQFEGAFEKLPHAKQRVEQLTADQNLVGHIASLTECGTTFIPILEYGDDGEGNYTWDQWRW